ncbi:DUF1656 domain-containing protein [Tardiphaga sp. vice352]|uniref:DUF1656 domain-containing protein n=1 Tax=unclassified Tardiphaga TaxID=2631404 RepID=UPI001164D7E3|nr:MULTISPECIES: DUF1656 domain-containing protein [unclassified Tardiphaga]MBC7585674.1 DUF1656 domain-containing protein [Tardiphaga sp.]QDM18652.1 DUF1656 domain-containing protein [Tardiphaga sp. vice278]QDM23648.1 DUF1656 domain-containing protein [Tardiphaga sp. vice154]QDM28872.1 DUF1656 domain-containing protein [Tardiphaga sp. vice304]QDM33972.1 DUF1656 domain-containing protein [Tardiphaga sp. vice352]
MRFEIDLFGILVPALLLWLILTYLIGALLRPLMVRGGLYNYVWHPALFDLALFVCLLGGVVYLSSGLLP